jgi:excisionase family DNA binding protein
MEQPDSPHKTVRWACDWLGVSRSTLYRYLGREIPVTRIGKSVRIRIDDLERFARAHRTGTGSGGTV